MRGSNCCYPRKRRRRRPLRDDSVVVERPGCTKIDSSLEVGNRDYVNVCLPHMTLAYVILETDSALDRCLLLSFDKISRRE